MIFALVFEKKSPIFLPSSIFLHRPPLVHVSAKFIYFIFASTWFFSALAEEKMSASTGSGTQRIASFAAISEVDFAAELAKYQTVRSPTWSAFEEVAVTPAFPNSHFFAAPSESRKGAKAVKETPLSDDPQATAEPLFWGKLQEHLVACYSGNGEYAREVLASFRQWHEQRQADLTW